MVLPDCHLGLLWLFACPFPDLVSVTCATIAKTISFTTAFLLMAPSLLLFLLSVHSLSLLPLLSAYHAASQHATELAKVQHELEDNAIKIRLLEAEKQAKDAQLQALADQSKEAANQRSAEVAKLMQLTADLQAEMARLQAEKEKSLQQSDDQRRALEHAEAEAKRLDDEKRAFMAKVEEREKEWESVMQREKEMREKERRVAEAERDRQTQQRDDAEAELMRVKEQLNKTMKQMEVREQAYSKQQEQQEARELQYAHQINELRQKASQMHELR